jgi:hypothetical protein
MEKIIDTETTMEDILGNSKLSPNHGRGFLGSNSEYGKPGEKLSDVLPRMDNLEWEKTEVKDEFSQALTWHKDRINPGKIEQVMDYDDARILFANFWADYIPEGTKLFVHPKNVANVQQILKWAIGDPSSEIPPQKSIWLWGLVGAGKSVFATALHDFFMYLYESPGQVKFKGKPWEFADMNMLFVKAKFDPAAFKVLNTDYCLILDELKENHFIYRHFGQDQRIIGDLLSARYSAWKRSNVRTFVTTNLEPGDELLKSVLDDREIDRMVEMFKSIHWHGDSLRKN